MPAILLLLLCLPGIVSAHALLLDVEHRGETITGTMYYSSGELAVRESVELLDMSTPNATAVVGETDDDGKFSFPVTAKHRYRISAYAAEGHGVDVELEAGANSRPTLIDDEAAEQSSLPLAWVVLGALLIASMVPTLISRHRKPVAQ